MSCKCSLIDIEVPDKFQLPIERMEFYLIVRYIDKSTQKFRRLANIPIMDIGWEPPITHLKLSHWGQGLVTLHRLNPKQSLIDYIQPG